MLDASQQDLDRSLTTDSVVSLLKILLETLEIMTFDFLHALMIKRFDGLMDLLWCIEAIKDRCELKILAPVTKVR